MVTPGPKPGDFLPPELLRLLGTAQQAVDQHVNRRGRCAACASPWPCRQAELAEFALGVPCARKPRAGIGARDMPPTSRAAPVPTLPHLTGTGPHMHQRPSPRTQARQLTLAAHPAAVPRARQLAGQALTEWGMEGLSATALLLVSELVTNAVRASAHDGPAHNWPRPRAEVAVTLSLTGASLLIEVWDAHPGPAARQHPDATAESGRGLLIVEALASSWGQRAADGGKVVWCEIGLSSPPPAPRRCEHPPKPGQPRRPSVNDERQPARRRVAGRRVPAGSR
jgi:anti-sigma regulatory factor (Ser/Thr protein kinase)